MADSRDITGKNRKFTGTGGIKLPTGTEAQRVNETGQLRFNTETNLAEYYDGTSWKPIDSPPTLSSVSPSNPVDDGSTVTTITLTGTSFQSGSTLTIIGNDTTEYDVASFTVVSDTSITFSYTTALAGGGTNTPYSIKYSNPSGLTATISDFAPNVGPVFDVASGSLGSIAIGANGSTFTQPTATDTIGGTLVYSISVGALPDGVSQNSSTGALSGTTTTAGTFSFTVQVTDGTTTIERQYNATVVNPYIVATGGTVSTSGDYKTHIFTGSADFVVTNAGTPGGADTVSYLVIAGGGYGQPSSGGGGGGGYREGSVAGQSPWTTSPLATTGVPVTVTTYPITVGGGAGTGASGGNSVFGTITSAGGGRTTLDGGSGGGAGRDGPGTFGSGNTPPVSPPQGNNGGNSPIAGWCGSGGGGGAGGVGSNGAGGSQGAERSGPGGPGTSTSITGSSVTYAGGGGGFSQQGTHGSGGSGGGGSAPGGSGSTNRGGGGGGDGGNGGSGYVVIRYKFQ